MKFHAKERKMDLVRRRRWHKKLVCDNVVEKLVKDESYQDAAVSPPTFFIDQAKDEQRIMISPRMFLNYDSE